jgi:hypothetical protein
MQHHFPLDRRRRCVSQTLIDPGAISLRVQPNAATVAEMIHTVPYILYRMERLQESIVRPEGLFPLIPGRLSKVASQFIDALLGRTVLFRKPERQDR